MIGNESRNVIYIAGKMTGLDDAEIKKRRGIVVQALNNSARGFFRKSAIVDPYNYYGLADGGDNDCEDKEFIRWQLNMVRNSAVVVVIWDKTQSSLGTMAELTTAYENRVPIILYNADKINRDEIHPYVNYMASKIFEDADVMASYIGSYYF